MITMQALTSPVEVLWHGLRGLVLVECPRGGVLAGPDGAPVLGGVRREQEGREASARGGAQGEHQQQAVQLVGKEEIEDKRGIGLISNDYTIMTRTPSILLSFSELFSYGEKLLV